MTIYLIIISVVDDTHNITRPLLTAGHKTKTAARQELAQYKALYSPKEGYTLNAETADNFIFTVRTESVSYTLTLAIESIVIN